MTDFYAWKYITEKDFEDLEVMTEANSIKRLISELFHINFDDCRKSEIIIDFHFYNYIFCKESAFDGKKTSTYMSIMNDLLQRDIDSVDFNDNATISSNWFQEQLLRHSVERLAESIQVFSVTDTVKILENTNLRYFRNFKLYKFIFGKQLRFQAKQVFCNNVEYINPQLFTTLSSASESPSA